MMLGVSLIAKTRLVSLSPIELAIFCFALVPCDRWYLKGCAHTGDRRALLFRVRVRHT